MLREKGKIIVAIVDRNSFLGKLYAKKKFVQTPERGHGKGGFVVISGTKHA